MSNNNQEVNLSLVDKSKSIAPPAVALLSAASLAFGSAAYGMANEAKENFTYIEPKEKVYGFGEVDPEVMERKKVDIPSRVADAATYAMAFMGMALDMGVTGGILTPLVWAGTSVFVGYSDSLDHPSTSLLGLNAEDNDALPLNTYGDNHSVIVTEDSTESFAWKKELIKSAKHSIELSGSFCAGPAFREILDLMEEKMVSNRDIQIRILCTPDLLQGADKQRLKELQEKYPDNFHLLLTAKIPITSPGVSMPEMHVKLLVVDEEYFVMGGSNLQESMLSKGDGTDLPREDRDLFEQMSGSNWRDMDMVGKGPAAKTLRLEFYKLWAKWAYLEKAEDDIVSYYTPININDAWCDTFERSAKKVNDVALKVIPTSPQWAENEISKEYVKQLDEAIAEKKDITIANMIFYPSDEIIEKIQTAIKTGCKVTIISTNLGDNAAASNKIFFGANRHGFYEVLKAAQEAHMENNLEIYEYNMPDGIYHKKTWAIGDDISIFSSSNLGQKSELYDDELSIIIKSKEVTDQVKAILEKDKQYSKKLTEEEIASIGSRLNGVFSTIMGELM